MPFPGQKLSFRQRLSDFLLRFAEAKIAANIRGESWNLIALALAGKPQQMTFAFAFMNVFRCFVKQL